MGPYLLRLTLAGYHAILVTSTTTKQHCTNVTLKVYFVLFKNKFLLEVRHKILNITIIVEPVTTVTVKKQKKTLTAKINRLEPKWL